MALHSCPWLIDDRAAYDLLRITGRVGDPLAVARAELRRYIQGILERVAQPRVLASGMLQYRSGRPLRARLIVDPETHPPTLITVRADYEGRRAPYARSVNSQFRKRTR